MVKMLLDAGANPDARNENGNTALQCAVMKKDINIIIELLEKGADAQLQNKSGKDTLFFNKRFPDRQIELLLKESITPAKIDHNLVGFDQKVDVTRKLHQANNPEKIIDLIKTEQEGFKNKLADLEKIRTKVRFTQPIDRNKLSELYQKRCEIENFAHNTRKERITYILDAALKGDSHDTISKLTNEKNKLIETPRLAKGMSADQLKQELNELRKSSGDDNNPEQQYRGNSSKC
jgi:hypothetical protein